MNATLVFVAVAGVAVAALTLAERHADQQALARVALGVESARLSIEAATDQMVTLARLVAEQPTVLRLLEDDKVSELSTLLKRFGETSGLLEYGLTEGEHGFVGRTSGLLMSGVHERAGGGFAIHGSVRLPAAPDRGAHWATVAVAIDDAFLDRLAQQTGLEISLTVPRNVAFGPERQALRAAAFSSEQRVTGRVGEEYRAVLPLAGGERVLLEVALPRAEAMLSPTSLRAPLLGLAAVVGLVVAAVGLAIGRRLSRGLNGVLSTKPS